MNNDDIFKKTGHNNTSSTELEARVVAWVLGEASPFEAADLERLCTEQPELAVFKRRIEAVHGLAGEAASPPKTPLLLSPERRAKVLAVIGGSSMEKPADAAPRKPRGKKHSWRSWALQIAACLTVMTGLASVIMPTVGSAYKRVPQRADLKIQNQTENTKSLGDSVLSNQEDMSKLEMDGTAQAAFAGYADRGAAVAGLPDMPSTGSEPVAAPISESKISRDRPFALGKVASMGAKNKPVDKDAGELRLVASDAAPHPEQEFQSALKSAIAGGKKDVLPTGRADVKFNDGLAAAQPSKPAGEVGKELDEMRSDQDSFNSANRRRSAFDESLRAETATNQESVSTFSLHVSDASFRLAKAALERGQVPDPATIRPEEFYNAFDYSDPAPAPGEPVSCLVEQAAHPFLQQRNLVRIAMKVPAAGRGAGQPLRLTVLLDTSGSMEREDRAATVRAAFTSLTALLGPDDRVTLVGFARTPRLLAESVAGDQASKLIELAARTPAEGGTNLEEALALAGNLALRQKLSTAQNRIVLLTDGAANLGDADPQALARRVEALRQKGIAFDACGIVADGLDDSVLEALTRKGDGRYTVINSAEDADASFARQLAGAFRPAAKDVKVQVRFNPARVAHYRLIGFEQHRLKTEDFRNDAVDAAELAAEEAAVALYQVEVLPDGEGELGDVFVRFLDTRSQQRVERSWTLAYAPQPASFARATPSLQLAGSAAFLAEKLRGGTLAGQVRLDEFAPVVEALGAAYPQAERVKEFITMFRQTRRLTGE